MQHRRKVSSVLEITGFWRTFAYNIGGLVYTLDDLEHGILRENAGHPSDGGRVAFDEGDPRLVHAVPLDSRIHFALVCGAKGCPRLRAYHAATLDNDLGDQVAEYLDEKVSVTSRSLVRTATGFRLMVSDTLYCISTMTDLTVDLNDGLTPLPLLLSQVVLPRLVQWYSSDFGRNDMDVVTALTCLARGPTRDSLEMAAAKPASLRVSFGSYNWDLNK